MVRDTEHRGDVPNRCGLSRVGGKVGPAAVTRGRNWLNVIKRRVPD